MNAKRILKELEEIKLSKPSTWSIEPTSNSNLSNWIVKISGPENTPYEGGVFMLEVIFPPNYPFKEPKIHWKTKVYHPQILSDIPGCICIDILQNQWSPALTISKVISEIINILKNPHPEDSLVLEISEQLRNNPDLFYQTAKEWTQLYAQPSAQ